MAKRTKIDELNILNSEQVEASFDYKDYIEHYFDPMQINEKQRRERIEEAEELFDAILLFLIWCEENPENVQREDTKREMENLYKEVIFQKVEPDDFIDIYVQFFINNLVDVTTKNQGDEYFTSVERATNMACNEANSVVNYSEVQRAKESGYSHKQWVAELDERTRFDHIEMDGSIVPIDDYFAFSDCLMFMPHDEVNGTARQCVNCRCSLKYIRRLSINSDKSRETSLEYISNGKAGLDAHRQSILSHIPNQGMYERFDKNMITDNDMMYISAYTNDEFALFRSKNEDILIHGGPYVTEIPTTIYTEIMSGKYEFISHTHVDTGDLVPSKEDRIFLKELNQKKSKIISARTGKIIWYTSNLFDI